jgi:UDP-glucose 4-epimerase
MPPRAGDPAVLIGDAGKVAKFLGWHPAYADLRQIIATTWAWLEVRSCTKCH